MTCNRGFRIQQNVDTFRPNGTVNKHCLVVPSNTSVEYSVAGWLSGNMLVSVNEVKLHPAWLVLGWLTVCGV